jgi:putative ABC transport system ATP-binding protein
MTIAATLQNINKEFIAGDTVTRVLHNISLEVSLGELTMLIGPSGCGKTTLISILSGILSSTSGSTALINQCIDNLSDREKVLFRRENIGFIFQQYNLLPALTAAENAAMPLLAAGIKDEVAIAKAREILEHIGMQGHTEKFPRQLSGGQQQRVAIARALVHNPKIIVCDEPTAALDAISGQAVMKILREIANDADRAVFIVTHDNRIYHFADRIVEMSDGRIIDDCPASEFINQEHA